MSYGLQELAEDFGYDDSFEMLQDYFPDDISPAICTKCGYTTEYEQDSTNGYCENCGKQTCVSAFILAGIM